ncbi:MAG: hypothetical protein GEU73_16405 [Chloroflexi bacterium]|nr:hypothetical protein [Chloroflexota bacterium]
MPLASSPGRCYALGQAIRQAVERWDSNARVAIMASGSLSHQIIDEDLDHAVIDAMAEGNVNVHCSLSRERLNRAPGTPEILN